MSGAILLTGWTGNTGAQVLRLLRQHHPDTPVVGVSRNPVERRICPDVCEWADLSDPVQTRMVFQKHAIRWILHLANIRQSPTLLTVAEDFSVERAVLVHTTGMYSKFQQYGGLYREIENRLLTHPPRTPLTVLRPTMIYGNTDETRDHNMHKLAIHLSRARWFPLFNGGRSKMQPVHVADVAAAVLAALYAPETWRDGFNISGGSEVTFREIVETICDLLKRKPVLIPLPVPPLLPLVAAYEKVKRNPQVTVEQMQRLTEDKCYSFAAAQTALGFQPRRFAEGIAEEIAMMQKAGLLP